MEILSAILFALAVSVDGFGVGLAYGMTNIRISILPILVICATSAVAITLSMYFGTIVASLFSPEVATRFGALILMAIGIWIILQTLSKWKKLNTVDSNTAPNPCLIRFKIPGIGIVIQILKEPKKADFDRSGNISSKEALFLGFALAMDALGAGFGAAVAGYQMILIPIFVAVFKFILLNTGLWFGGRSYFRSLGLAGSLLPGIILMLMGFAQL